MLSDRDNDLLKAIKENEPINKFIADKSVNAKHGKHVAYKCYDCGEINISQ